MKLLAFLVLKYLSPHFIHSVMIFLSPPYLTLENAILTIVSANFSFSSSLKSFILLRQAFLLLAKHPKSLSHYLKWTLSSMSVLWCQETLFFQIQNQSKTNPSAFISHAYCKSRPRYYKIDIWGKRKSFSSILILYTEIRSQLFKSKANWQ